MVRSRLKNLKQRFMAVLMMVTTMSLLSNSLFSVALAEPTDAPSDPTPIISAVVEGGPEIKAGAAVVMDINTGAVLYSKNGGEARQPSSLTKLMTAYVTFNERKIYDSLTVSATAASQNFPTAANVGFRSGESVTVEDALKGMLLASAEDCTYSLAERTCSTMDSFAQMMNSYGDKLELKNTHFVNSMGLHAEGHYSSAYDLAVIASKLMKNYPVYKSILTTNASTISATNFHSERVVSSTHRFMVGSDKYEYSYAGKTGGSAHGGNGLWSLCTYATHGNINAVCIILDGPSNDSTYADTKALLNYVFETYESRQVKNLLSNSTSEIGTLFNECPLFDVSSRSSIYISNNSAIALPAHTDLSLITTKVTFDQLTEFVYGENTIGEIDFYYNNVFCGAADIIFYTEEASMSATEFAALFPAFMKMPDSISHNTIENHNNKPSSGFFGKIKAGVASLLTPAKIFSFIIALIIFSIGALIVMLVFPRKKEFENNLYSSRYDEEPNSELEGEALSVHRRRNPKQPDMKEF